MRHHMEIRDTACGFAVGSIEVTRLICDEEDGTVILLLKTPKQAIELYAMADGTMHFLDFVSRKKLWLTTRKPRRNGK